jgi:hypothetical protein
LCGSSPANNILNWTLEGAGKGLVVGAVTGGITGTLLGTPVGGVIGAFAGGVVDGAVGGATGVLWNLFGGNLFGSSPRKGPHPRRRQWVFGVRNALFIVDG